MKLHRLQSRVRNIPLSPAADYGDMRSTTAHMRLRGRTLQIRNTRIARRDTYTCQICGRVADRGEGEVDHRIPLAQGGSDESNNLQWLCIECHRAKTDRENSQR